MHYLILVFTAVFIFFVSLLNISRIKISLHKIALYFIITYFLAAKSWFISPYIPVAFIDGDLLGNASILLFLICIMLKETKDLKLSMYYSIFAVIIPMMCSTLISLFVGNIFIGNIFLLRYDYIVFAVYYTSVVATVYFLSRFISSQLHKTYNRLTDEAKGKFTKKGLILVGLTYFLSHLNLVLYRTFDGLVFFSSLNLILITSIFMVTTVIFAAHTRSLLDDAELVQMKKSLLDLKASNEKLDKSYDDIRRYFHDHRNIMHTLLGFSAEKDWEGLNAHIENVMDYTDAELAKIDSSREHLKFVHIPELRGLLSVKFAHALANGIELEIDIADPVSDIPIDTLDLCRMVGILVDNAIDELLCGGYDKKLLRFGILLEKEETLIVCTNTCKTHPDVEDIFKKGFTTRDSNRGMGLYNLQKICNKVRNVIPSIHLKDGEFMILLTAR
jgi:two-component system sensor histidine kinase AgrC